MITSTPFSSSAARTSAGDPGVGDQFIDALGATDDVGAFAAKFRGVRHQDHLAGGVAHGFADGKDLIEGGDAGIQIDAVRAHKQFVETEMVKGVFRQLAVE